MNCCTPRVTVCEERPGARMSGNHRSFQIGEHRQGGDRAQPRTGTRGVTTERIRNSPAPSMRAASFSSCGTDPEVTMSATPSGRLIPVYTRMRAVVVLTRFQIRHHLQQAHGAESHREHDPDDEEGAHDGGEADLVLRDRERRDGREQDAEDEKTC